MRSSGYFKIISRILIFAMIHLCWLTSYGYAEMVSTESSLQFQGQPQTDRQRILDLLDRQEVVDELEKYGISKVEATARFNSLTDEEVTVISGKLDELAAGGYNIVGTSLFIFILAIFIVFTPIAAVGCIFVDETWADCMLNYWGNFDKGIDRLYRNGSKGDNDSKGETVVHPDCDPGMESCT